MDDLEKKAINNSYGINTSIDLSNIIDNEIREIDIDKIKEKKNKNKNKKNKRNTFSSYLIFSISKLYEHIGTINNSKDPEIIILINILLGLFFYFLSNPPIPIEKTTYFYSDDIIYYLEISLIMIIISSFFFSFVYLIMIFSKKEINIYIRISPLFMQLLFFLFCDNEINDILNFGIFRKITMFLATLIFLILGIFISENKRFLLRKNKRMKIILLVFYLIILFYLSILNSSNCEKNKTLIEENLIDDTIGCSSNEREKSCFVGLVDDLFDLNNFFSFGIFNKNNEFLDKIFEENKKNSLLSKDKQNKEKTNNRYDTNNGPNHSLERKIIVFPEIKNIIDKNKKLVKNNSDISLKIDLINSFLENIRYINTDIHIDLSLDLKPNKVNKTFDISHKNETESEYNKHLNFLTDNNNNNHTLNLNNTTNYISSENKNKNDSILKEEEKDPLSILHNQEIYYDYRNNNPFLNINPQNSEEIDRKINLNKDNKNPNTIILLEFENLKRLKFKTKFQFTYSFIQKYLNSANYFKNKNKIDDTSLIKDLTKKYITSLSSKQFFKFYPSYKNFSQENGFVNTDRMVKEANKENYLTFLGSTDIKIENLKQKYSNNYDNTNNTSKNELNSYDKIIFQNLYSKYEAKFLKNGVEDESKLFNNYNLLLEYSKKFVSKYNNVDKFIHLQLDQSTYTKKFDKDLLLFLKNIKNQLKGKMFSIVLYSSISPNKSFLVNDFNDIYGGLIDRKAMTFFTLSPKGKIDNKVIEYENLSENFPICQCDLFNYIEGLIGNKNKLNKNLEKFKKIKESKFFLNFR